MSDEKRCGYRSGDTEKQCEASATVTLPYHDGEIHLCEYHAGLIVGYAVAGIDPEKTESEKAS